MKPVSITLTQEPGGDQFRVKAFSNTSQLRVGQIVGAETVERWINHPDLRHVSVSVVGPTPETAAETQADLFAETPTKGKGKATARNGEVAMSK